MAQPPNITPVTRRIDQRPFLGLRSFEERNKAQFGGRDREIKELFGLIDDHGLSVVFGKSGIGKTSLLKAGLMPELRQNFYQPIYVRIDYSSSKKPLDQVRKIIHTEMAKADPTVQAVGDVTLWEYFHITQLKDGLLEPVLILDQFEEMFTLGDDRMRDVLELVVELADLAENRIPLVVQKEYKESGKTVPSLYGEQPYRVVLSLREDYLARLEELKRFMPSIMDNRFRVVQMTISQALDAAIKPGKGILEDDVAREIIKKLPGVSQSDFDLLKEKGAVREKLKVEPFLLSLICDRINEKRIVRGDSMITAELVNAFNVSDVIQSFYNETIQAHGSHVARAIEDRLLTEGGFRKLQELEELQNQFEISTEIVDVLVDSRILRKELRDGVEYVELIHDVLAPVIQKIRTKRLRAEREEQRKAAVAKLRAKNRKRLLQIGLVVSLLLLVTAGFAIYNYQQRTATDKRNKKMALARSLVFTAQSVGSYEAKNEKAALLARCAYKIYDQYKSDAAGEGMYGENFYNSMFVALKNMGIRFEVRNFPQGIRDASYLDSLEQSLVALRDGTVQTIAKDTVYDFSGANTRVTDMDQFKANGVALLALTGTMNEVVLHDLMTGNTLKTLPIPGAKKRGKSVGFTNNRRLVVQQDSSLVAWEAPYEELKTWDQRPYRVWNDSSKIITTAGNTIAWGGTTLTLPGNQYCMNIAKDGRIAVGSENALFFIGEEEVLEVRYQKEEIGRVSAIRFLDKEQQLIIGNQNGQVFTVALADFSLRSHQSHSAKITDIAVGPEETLVATASADRNVVIWNTKENEADWTALPLSANVLLNPNVGTVYSVDFTPDGEYLYAGYNDGTIMGWPVNMDVLARVICSQVKESIGVEALRNYEAELSEYIDLNDLDPENYRCD